MVDSDVLLSRLRFIIHTVSGKLWVGNSSIETELTMVNSDILEIANQASLKISTDDKTVDIKHQFRLGDKSIWGTLFFLGGGIFLIVAPFIKTSDTTSKILGIIIGLLLLALSIWTLIRQVSDRLKITGNNITFRHNLKRTNLQLNGSMKVKMKTEILKVRRVGTLGSDFIHVTHYLQDLNEEIPVLKFQMDNLHAGNARKLGNEITRVINDKIQKFS
jgi:hypothetical protein